MCVYLRAKFEVSSINIFRQVGVGYFYPPIHYQNKPLSFPPTLGLMCHFKMSSIIKSCEQKRQKYLLPRCNEWSYMKVWKLLIWTLFFSLLLSIISQHVFLHSIVLIHKLDIFLYFLSKNTNANGILFFIFVNIWFRLGDLYL